MSEHRTIPTERLFWAVLESKPLGPRPLVGGRRYGERLGYLFEESLPVPIDEIHAVYAETEDGRTIACGMEREMLRTEAHGCLTLTPETPPEFVGPNVEVANLNLLQGEFEPERVRAARSNVVLAAGLLLALGLLAGGLGMVRRTAHWAAEQRATDGSIAQVYRAVLPPDPETKLPPALRLTTELRRLRQTESPDSIDLGARDASLAMAGMLASWPGEVHARTDTLTASPTSLAVTVVAPDAESAEALIAAIAPPPDGWRKTQPAMTNRTDGVEVRLSFTREEQR